MSSPIPLYDTAAARDLDQRATEALGGDAYVLMSRAGQAAWRHLLQHWPQSQRLLVLCGPGNNGGDGYVLARLAQEHGRQVQVLHAASQPPRSALCERAADGYRAAGGAIEVFDGALPPADLLVDAIFGIGLRRAPEGDAAALIEAANAHPADVFALDVPSGLDSDRGSAPGVVIRARRTLQFIAPHQGLSTGDGLLASGERATAALAVAGALLEAAPSAAELLLADALPRWFAPRGINSHKGSSGRVLCVGGNHGSGGALLVTAQAALRAGAGLVWAATRVEHVPAFLARQPEIMVHGVESNDGLEALLARCDVVALGPGLGLDDWSRAMWSLVLRSGKPCVVDADALNLLAERGERFEDAILTPHPGEAARLLGISTGEVQADRFGTAQALAARYSSVVVLKGAGTLVAAGGQRTQVIGAGNPGMAVGGMGDLLTGVIAAARAGGLGSFDAARAGALLHSVAGDHAADDGGQRGLLPSDLLPWLRRCANPAQSPGLAP
ncbi:MAG: NAD(P)H-hydrate dehydratase [Pseudoxanthomonas sp.]